MDLYKFKALQKEFPFIKGLDLMLRATMRGDMFPLYDLGSISDIHVRRVDRLLLDETGRIEKYHDVPGIFYNYTVFFAVSKSKTEGNSDGWKVRLLNSSCIDNDLNVNRKSYRESSRVGEQLFMEDVIPEYIVECIQSYSGGKKDRRVVRSWTIHKMDKFDLASWHEKRMKDAKELVGNEIKAAFS